MARTDEKCVLLVEDSPDDAALTTRALRRSGVPCEIVHARDGEEALSRLREGVDRARRGESLAPAFVLLDLKMPKVDGIETLERIRADERIRHIPVVIFTSSNEPGDVARSYLAGASSFVRKPIHFNEFADAVRGIAEYWLRWNEAPPLAVSAAPK